LVFATSPTLVTPVLGVASASSLALGGAAIGANALAVVGTSSFAGNVFPAVDNTRTLGTSALGWSAIFAATAGVFVFGARSALQSSADGLLDLSNNAGTSFNRINLGPLTNAFPALKRTGAQLTARLADDSADAQMNASLFSSSNGSFLYITTAALTNNAGASSATLTNAPVVGNPTKWIPINDNGITRNIPAW